MPQFAAAQADTSFFNSADIISVYTLEEGVADGVLVDLRKVAPKVTAEHFGPDAVQRPVVCTRAVWDLVQRAINAPRQANDLEGVLHDIMWMSRGAIGASLARGESRALPFIVIITGTGRTRKHTIMAHIVVERVAGRVTPGAVTYHMPFED